MSGVCFLGSHHLWVSFSIHHPLFRTFASGANLLGIKRDCKGAIRPPPPTQKNSPSSLYCSFLAITLFFKRT